MLFSLNPFCHITVYYAISKMVSNKDANCKENLLEIDSVTLGSAVKKEKEGSRQKEKNKHKDQGSRSKQVFYLKFYTYSKRIIK